jgi:putative DNA primase/helicase
VQTLTDNDLYIFAALGIGRQTLAQAGVRRVDDREARELLGVRNLHGDLSGVLYPRPHPVRGYVQGYRVRRDHPEMEEGQPRNKYLSSIDRAHLFFAPGAAPLLRDLAVRVVLVESEKAALALTEAAGRAGRQELAIGLGGCWGWKGRIGKTEDANGARVDEHGVLPDFDLITWKDREVVIAFDGNATTNTSVKAARRGLAEELTGRGALVRCVDVPQEPGVNGPDDYLRVHGDEALWALLDTITGTVTFKRTDAGNAEMFAARHAANLRFDHAAQIWRRWTGHHWTVDRDGAVRRLAKETLRARLDAAATLTQDTERKEEIRWSLQSESRRGLDAMLALAQSERPLAVTGDDWDRQPMLLGVQNGVIDLETGALRDGHPDDGITRVAPIACDPTATCPRWDRFIAEIFAQHPDLPFYIQRVIGYVLTGLTVEQAILILFGGGANGKSTLVETLLKHVFGADLAWTMPFPSASWTDTLGDYQKAMLAGRRLIAASEVAKQGRLNEQLIKSLTGGDVVSARHPYGRPFTFVPVGKIFLLVNERPQVRDESHGMWRRIKLVPFLETFTIDTTLSATLAAEAPGILNWAIRGCLDWQREGLCEPDVVKAATAEYRDEQDQVATFLDTRCVCLEGVSVRAGALYDAYKQWAADNVRSDDRLSQTAFGKRMKTRVRYDDTGRHTIYYGVGLATDDRENDLDAA